MIKVMHPDGTNTIIEKEAPVSLKQAQLFVGGTVQLVPFWKRHEGARCAVLVDEDGKMKRKPYNSLATTTWHTETNYSDDFLVGDVLILTDEHRKGW